MPVSISWGVLFVGFLVMRACYLGFTKGPRDFWKLRGIVYKAGAGSDGTHATTTQYGFQVCLGYVILPHIIAVFLNICHYTVGSSFGPYSSMTRMMPGLRSYSVLQAQD